MPGALAAAATSGALIAQQVAGKAVRDAMFLSSFAAHWLPIVMGAGAVLSLVVVIWFSRVVVRRSPATALPWLFAGSAAALVFSWALGFASAPAAALWVYFQTALLGPLLITTFWSLINERFDPHTAKRAVARISAGGTLGGVLGGLFAWRVSSLVELPTMLLLLAMLNVGCAIGSVFVAGRKTAPRPELTISSPVGTEGDAPEAPNTNAFGILRRSPFLRSLAYLVALGSILSALLDYIFSMHAAAAIPKGGPLLSFFSLFWLSVGIASFALQVALGRLVIEKLGLAASIAFLPGTILVGSALAVAVPGLASASILRGADAVHRNTLFRSAYELFYTPIPEESKRATKALIDVGFDRAGTLVGSLMVLAALRLSGRHASGLLLSFVVFTALAMLPVVRLLHRGYVLALEDGLRKGAEALAEEAKASAAPLPRSSLEPKANEARDALLDSVEALQLGPAITKGLEREIAQRGRVEGAARQSPLARSKALVEAQRSAERMSADLRDLLSGDIGRARRVLERPPAGIRPLVAFAIPLLADPGLHKEARRALSRIANGVTGQLVDALFDSTMTRIIRRRIPRVLGACNNQRAVDGLLLGIADRSFEVRYECSKALLLVTTRNPQLILPPATLMLAVLREARLEPPNEGREGMSALAAELVADRRERRLKHIFAILSLEREREPLEIAFRALHHEDERHRGTALEYLETVLPTEVRDALLPFLGVSKALREPRSAPEILADLMSAMGRTGTAGAPIPLTAEDAAA